MLSKELLKDIQEAKERIAYKMGLLTSLEIVSVDEFKMFNAYVAFIMDIGLLLSIEDYYQELIQDAANKLERSK